MEVMSLSQLMIYFPFFFFLIVRGTLHVILKCRNIVKFNNLVELFTMAVIPIFD